jgi:hypothetical protein
MKNGAQPFGSAPFSCNESRFLRDVVAQPTPVDNVDKWLTVRTASPPQAAALACSIIATKRSKR